VNKVDRKEPAWIIENYNVNSEPGKSHLQRFVDRTSVANMFRWPYMIHSATNSGIGILDLIHTKEHSYQDAIYTHRQPG